jgi:translation initiation factor 2 subunit 2
MNPIMSEATQDYEKLLKRLRTELGGTTVKSAQSRLELPDVQIMWLGNKTIFRNFAEFPRLLRRDTNQFLMYLARELATAASLDGERAIFIGRKDKQSFAVLIQRYMKESVICPVCGSPDTKIERVKRLQFIVCEACGARSPVRTA